MTGTRNENDEEDNEKEDFEAVHKGVFIPGVQKISFNTR